MPKALKQSRWFLFTVNNNNNNNNNIDKNIKNSGCICSQYYLEDHVIKGYLFFQTTRPIPKKKIWIPGAQVELTDRDSLRSAYLSVPQQSWINYGSDLLFDPAIPPFKLLPTPPPTPTVPREDSLIGWRKNKKLLGPSTMDIFNATVRARSSSPPRSPRFSVLLT